MKPVILAVDDDPSSIGHISGELERRYARDYRIVFETSASAASARLAELDRRGERVALVLADQWMPDLNGVDLLAQAKQLDPRTKRALLIAWGEWADEATADAIRGAIATGIADHYVLKPWKSPDELFHRAITEYLHEWSRDDASTPHEVTVVAPRRSSRAHELRDLLTHNRVPHVFVASDSEEGTSILERSGHPRVDVPVVVLNSGLTLLDPSDRDVVDAYGVMTELPEDRSFDVVIVGAGPGGLAAAVYAASEGLSALVVERRAIGGQAGSSSMIRNYLGFARGVAGNDLTQRAYQQAWVFGTRFLLTHEATALRHSGGAHVVEVADGHAVHGNAVILSTGVSYRTLDIPALERLKGRGVYYGASPSEAPHFADGQVYLVGAGNSAGQAALYISRFARRCTLVVRGDSLEKSMSSYLVKEIGASPNIDVLLRTEVVDGDGGTELRTLTLRTPDGSTVEVEADALFLLIGAQPHTGWLPAAIERDEHGFIVTGTDLRAEVAGDRAPYPFETSVPGVFAVGDVRSGSVKRVASAVGEGSVVIQHVHRYLRR